MEQIYKDDYCHDLERGDHIIRWTNILIYPVQVSDDTFALIAK